MEAAAAAVETKWGAIDVWVKAVKAVTVVGFPAGIGAAAARLIL